MKRYFLGLVAVVLAIGFSAFTSKSAKEDLTSYYYFQIATSNYNLTDAVFKADATFLTFSATPPLGSGCNTTSTKQCVSGFEAAQVQAIPGTNPVQYELKDDNRVPIVTPRKKS
jgi:hypothetical protein